MGAPQSSHCRLEEPGPARCVPHAKSKPGVAKNLSCVAGNHAMTIRERRGLGGELAL